MSRLDHPRATDTEPARRPGTHRVRRGPDLADLRALLAEEPAEPEVVERARRLKESALLDFGVGQSVLASWLYAKCHHHIATTAVPTAAVVATGDGGCALLYNPYFLTELDLDGVKFVLFHEARHLMHRHLHVEEELRGDPAFVLAAEVAINHVAMRRLERSTLPNQTTRDEAGQPVPRTVGVDPRQVHQTYMADLRAQRMNPLPYDDFVYTDLTVYGELRRMTDPVWPEVVVCIHLDGEPDGDGESGGEDGESEGRDGESNRNPDGSREAGTGRGSVRGQGRWGVPLDDETVERVAGDVLQEVMRGALRGNPAAREELLDLADRTADGGERLTRLWGGLGLDKLRGSTPQTRRIDWWQKWLTDVLASKLTEAERLVYPKKHGAVLLALGHEPMLQRRGPERMKVVLVAFDTSGSMPDRVVEWLTTLVGQTDGVESHWLSFDGRVTPFVPGERVTGGGGTNFQNVVDYAEGRVEVDGKRFELEPDAIIMVTDGYAPAVTPAQPDRWIWLITDDGDDWPERHHPPMACHRVRSGQQA
ncbi:hypothetical protein GCM10022225_15560 [Plantactinospora mayteni]|uniref:Putative metallopeptidase domain-containing protein n=1 Tax=Plantactinospora mayteni TaxID=566021 RepID=A0ABQ4EFX9_9ACTN|nr:hypothetical protein [Plantactinospora mayteni]GIG93630.1 hypothetical protein Pma05_02030 [Plantactinospora mayteni]